MQKYTADAMALGLAAKAINADPKVLAVSGLSGLGPAAANQLADFIATLSSRLQVDIANEVDLTDVLNLLKSS